MPLQAKTSAADLLYSACTAQERDDFILRFLSVDITNSRSRADIVKDMTTANDNLTQGLQNTASGLSLSRDLIVVGRNVNQHRQHQSHHNTTQHESIRLPLMMNVENHPYHVMNDRIQPEETYGSHYDYNDIQELNIEPWSNDDTPSPYDTDVNELSPSPEMQVSRIPSVQPGRPTRWTSTSTNTVTIGAIDRVSTSFSGSTYEYQNNDNMTRHSPTSHEHHQITQLPRRHSMQIEEQILMVLMEAIARAEDALESSRISATRRRANWTEQRAITDGTNDVDGEDASSQLI